MIKQIFNLKYGLPKCMQELLFTWFTDPLIIGKRFDVKKKKVVQILSRISFCFSQLQIWYYTLTISIVEN